MLVNDMNNGTGFYEYYVGERQGSTNSKEQYGFIWNNQKLSFHDAYDYPDPDELFERPPTILYLDVLNEKNTGLRLFE